MSLLVDTRYVVIRQSQRFLLNRALGAAFFSIKLFCIYLLFSGTIKHGGVTSLCLMGIVYFFGLGIESARTSNFVFDFKNDRFRKEFQLGFFRIRFWKPMPNLEYVSISKFDDEAYPLKIYILENDNYLIGGFKDAKSGLAAAKSIGAQLEIDAWDETVPGDGRLMKHT